MIPVPLLSLIVFLPLLGGLACLPAGRRASQGLALAVTGGELILVLALAALATGAPGAGGWLAVEDLAWMPNLGIRYSLALDGISLVMLILTAVIFPICLLATWDADHQRPGIYHFLLLAMQSGICGVFLASDLFLFYLFWELQLIPMFFLVGGWGHEDRLPAALKFVIFTMVGSLCMLLSLVGVFLIHGLETGQYTFSLAQLAASPPPAALQYWLLAGFLLGLGVKVPLVPLHTWLPDAHTQAPTAGSVILAGLLLKTGLYAMLRLAWPLFPLAAAQAGPLMMFMGLLGLFWASWLALAQRDLKRLVAYSSVGHMGLMVLGLGAWNLTTLSGTVLQMVNHGLTTAALFIMVGMVDRRLHSRSLEDMGGLWRAMPVFGSFFLFFALAALGLPGLNNFVGEFLILVGVCQAHPLAAGLGFLGLLPAVVYVLAMVHHTLYGPPRPRPGLTDLGPLETAVLASLAVAVLYLGLHPAPLLDLVRPPLQALLTGGAQMAAAAPPTLALGW